MFKQAAALLKSIVTPRPTSSGMPENEDRRVWVRFPARTEAQVKPADDDEGRAFNAKVLDVSIGGVKLQVNRAFQEGSLISVELPGCDESSEVCVLACVIRAQPHTHGTWILGCNFSRELDACDLQGFGIAKAKPVSPDQRDWPRFECGVNAYYTETCSPSAERVPVKVANLSAGGIALVVDREVKNGSMLGIDLFTAAGKFVTSILSCVVHIRALPDGKRTLGCNFICELSEEDLNALLFPTAPQ